jgi:hypothetical protein
MRLFHGPLSRVPRTRGPRGHRPGEGRLEAARRPTAGCGWTAFRAGPTARALRRFPCRASRGARRTDRAPFAWHRATALRECGGTFPVRPWPGREGTRTHGRRPTAPRRSSRWKNPRPPSRVRRAQSGKRRAPSGKRRAPLEERMAPLEERIAPLGDRMAPAGVGALPLQRPMGRKLSSTGPTRDPGNACRAGARADPTRARLPRKAPGRTGSEASRLESEGSPETRRPDPAARQRGGRAKATTGLQIGPGEGRKAPRRRASYGRPPTRRAAHRAVRPKPALDSKATRRGALPAPPRLRLPRGRPLRARGVRRLVRRPRTRLEARPATRSGFQRHAGHVRWERPPGVLSATRRRKTAQRTGPKERTWPRRRRSPDPAVCPRTGPNGGLAPQQVRPGHVDPVPARGRHPEGLRPYGRDRPFAGP